MARIKRIVLNKVFLSVLVTASIIATLFLTSLPAQALNITVTQPPSGTLGSAYTFTVRIDVENADLLPIQSVDLQIYNVASPSTYTASCTGLPLPTAASSTATKSYTGTFGTVSASGTTDSSWGYGYADRYGYGYGYQSGTWGTYHFGYDYGYGYGYSGSGLTSITYTVTWTPPTSWPTGTYNIKVLAYGSSGTALTHQQTISFTLNAPVVVAPPAPAPGVTNLVYNVNAQGVFIFPATPISDDGKVQLTINAGVVGTTKEGAALSQISITKMITPPAPPANSNIIGLTYDFGPEGATFNPPITVTFTYNPAALPSGVSESNLKIAYFDKATSKWVELTGITVDPVKHTVSGKVSHFTAFAVLGALTPVPTPTTPPTTPTTPPTTPTTPPTTPTTPPTTPTTPPTTPTTPPTTPTTPPTTPSGLSGWLIAVIVVVVVVIGVVLAYFLWWKRRRSA